MKERKIIHTGKGREFREKGRIGTGISARIRGKGVYILRGERVRIRY